MDKYYIKSDDWKKIYKFLQFQSGIRVKNEAKTRAFAEAIYCIMRLRGTWQSYTSPYLKNPIKAIATYHPSFLLHSPGQKAQSWQDMLMIKKALSTVA
ncbi:hypothetical protein Cva_00709 [Caedimonas varicaedens]|uniref:Uncharacterized protein n=1 Tax=Caedimonas varicaedens TaxID=1629334 RepID=A0A0K8MC34_9PROT|nr:hypothetical protein Cva_00709 [Caedimonas varicaedens]